MSKVFSQVNFPVCLAPMVGLSHVALRRLLRDYLPPGAVTLWPTEMLNSRKLPNEPVGQTPETKRLENEQLLVPQILGNNEEAISKSVKILQDWGADGIDINMGCPVQKALKHNYGVALMGDADYAARVVDMTVRNTRLPVSVKLRVSGPEQGQDYFFKFVKGLESSGAAWLTLHPRTGEQKHRGQADWSQIKALKQSTSLPIVGNGDIQTWQDVFSMKESTGCDLVMSGRALAARPWMLWQVGERLGWDPPVGMSGRAPQTPEEEGQEYGRAVIKMIDYCEQAFTPDLALRKFKFYLKTTHVWLDFGHALCSLASGCQDISTLREKISAFFEQKVEMKPCTELRQ
jgi:tRNA-dihydrouridine synthase B